MTYLTLTSRSSIIDRVQVYGGRHIAALLLLFFLTGSPTDGESQFTAIARPTSSPIWNKGLMPISPESYYNAIECGKQGGDDPPCVFWDTGLCENPDFTLSAYSAYKQIAYQVWVAVRSGRPAPQPDFNAAQRTRVTIGVEQIDGSHNELRDFILKRNGETVRPVDRNIRAGRITFDYPAWTPTAMITLEIIGNDRSLTCSIEPSVLRQFR